LEDFYDLFYNKDCLKTPTDFFILYFLELENQTKKMAKYVFWDFFKKVDVPPGTL